MRDAAVEAVTFARGRTRSDVSSDRMLVLALIKDIEIVGEAAYRVSETTRSRLSDIRTCSQGCRGTPVPPDPLLRASSR